MTEIFFRYLHFIGIMSLAATLVMQHLILSSEVTQKELKKIIFLDTIYAISILLTLIAGLSLWLSVGKEAVFYSTNWIFHMKLTLFIVIIVFSIYPTLFFRKSRKLVEEIVQMPKMIIMSIRMQLLLVFIIPLLGVLIAKG
ncbi:MAG: putative membrane protein [Arcobacteraceae bacterium]|jgi:putative membrane protein